MRKAVRPRAAPKARGTPLEPLAEALRALRSELLLAEKQSRDMLELVPKPRRDSARNLIHYLALRRRDIRHLQDELAPVGLSSLGRAESNVLYVLEAVLGVLERLTAGTTSGLPQSRADFNKGRALLESNTAALLGPGRDGRAVRIMVTMPSDAAHDYALVRELVSRGMDAMRINCAHDTPEEWAAMIANVRRAEREVGHHCSVLMDLGGPKLRTGAIARGEPVVSFRPRRDALGRVTAPARVWLTPDRSAVPAPLACDATLPLDADWLAALETGDAIRLIDARGARRSLRVVAEHGEGRWAEAARATYVTNGTVLTSSRVKGMKAKCRVLDLPAPEQVIVVRQGDTLLLTRETTPGHPATFDEAGRVLVSASIPCTLPEALGAIRPGERVFIDDGKVGGVVRTVGAGQVVVEITRARPRGERIRSDKGINLPDTLLALQGLTEKDLLDLPFVARNADLVGLSFVQRPEDISLLAGKLHELGAAGKGVVLKIETRRAFESLPGLLLAALRLPRAGIMIARGDLLVECGYERLAEIQEEMLWLCEAAHIPVIWATQVLEGLAQKGLPSRAEITDAAMGERAECVMLNKGPHILAAVDALVSILNRMGKHQDKKTSRLRRLHF
ncbi:MAG: pyruvate kinase [Acidobacteria bacterium]|nr:pyruvate kinase [Acidobacteriota bacterium]